MRDASRLLVGVGMLIVLLTVPAAAATGQQTAPPNSEVDQYLPTIPGAGGDQNVGGGGDQNAGGGPGGRSNGGGSIPPATGEQLRSLGPAGEDAAAFFDEQGAPTRASGAAERATRHEGRGTREGRGGSDGDEGTSVVAASGDSQSPVTDLVDALTGDADEGLGILLPLLLAVIAAGGVGFALKRRVGRSARPG